MEVSIKFQLPDGQENALIAEFATFHWWTGEGKAGDYAKGVLAEVIKSSIIRSREEQAQKTAKESVVEPAIT